MGDGTPRGPAAGPALIGVAVLAAFTAVLRASQPLLDGIDPFWHLDLGRRIVTSGLPEGDPYSFLTEGRDWVLNQWGTEAIIGIIDRVGGLWLLAVFTAILVAGAYGLAGWLAWRRAPSMLTAALLGLAIMSHTNNWSLRGNLFSFLLLPVLLREILREDGPRIAIIAPLMVVWANLHAGFLTGVALLAAHGVGAAAISASGRRLATLGRGAALVAVGVLAGVVTPYGPRFLASTMDLAARAGGAGITEWAPTPITNPVVLPYTVLMATVLTALAVAGRREDLPEMLMAVATALLGVAAVRNIAPAAIVLTILGAPYVHRTWVQLRGHETVGPPRGPNQLDRALSGVVIVLGLLGVFAAVPRTIDIGAHTTDIPLAIIRELDALERPARVVTTGEWSAPLAALTGDHVRTAVDGRLELFSDEEIDAARGITAAEGTWSDQLTRWCATDVVVPRGSGLATRLNDTPDWTLATGPTGDGGDDAPVWYVVATPLSRCP